MRSYYQGFAHYLAQAGFTVLTYEFRGIGESQAALPDAPKPTMLDWGRYDMDAVMADFKSRHPNLNIKGLGHSIGGQLLGVMPDNNRYDSFLSIASQHIYWKNWPLKDRPMVALFFFGILPIFYHVAGGLPRWVLGAEYLPKGVARDWSRFGRKKAWIADEHGQPLRQGFHAYKGKMRLIGLTDDRRFAPPYAVNKLAQAYKNADAQVDIVHPKTYHMKSIDHFGFFKSKMNKAMWDDCANWLQNN